MAHLVWWRAGALALALASCAPPATNARTTEPGGGGGGASVTRPGGDDPSIDPQAELPIPTDREMPRASLSTHAVATLGSPVSVVVDARSDLFSAAKPAPDPDRGGVLPAAIVLPAGAKAIVFQRVTGRVGCGGGEVSGPDGGGCAGGHTRIDSAGGISGMIDASVSQPLLGVFVGANAPAAAPPVLDFSADHLGHDFPSLAPLVGQAFFIGDGMTASQTAQQFAVPAGATTLYLGIEDAAGFEGPPGYYADNVGGFGVTAVVR